MSRCGDCEYFTEPDSRYGKGECTYYNAQYYPDDKTCGHFKPGRGASCGSCEYFVEPDSRYSKGTCKYYDRDYYSSENACGHFARKSSSGGGCYLTSACCEFKGLADNCHELTTMRNFRDTYLKAQPYGEALIAAYYQDAPLIVKYIDSSPDKADIYADIYAQISRIVSLVENGEKETAIIHYMNLVYSLYREAAPLG